MIESVQIQYNVIEGFDLEFDDLLNDKISGLYGLFFSISALISPIIGGILFDAYGYNTTLDVCMVFVFIVSIIYFVFNCGLNVFTNQKKFQANLDSLELLTIRIKILPTNDDNF